jgi:CheY-like chemotaxis protein
LGLATVFGIVKQSDGHIAVYSELGQGATFKVYLPRVHAAIEESGVEDAFPGSLRGSETVLLVEDEGAVRELVRLSLERNGYNVLEAGNGAQALEISQKHRGPIHLMITDVVMPGMSGHELAHRLAPLHPKMNVLYVSGYTEDAITHHGVLDGGTALLQKPFRPSDLARKVCELLDRRNRGISEPSGIIASPASVICRSNRS